MKRREARELAFAIGFEKIITGETVSSIIDGAEAVREIVVPAFSISLAEGVEQNEAAIDEKIAQNIRGWTLERLPKVARSILRLAIYEMCYSKETPVSVVINEAVELSKRYEGDRAPGFVNGILNALAKSLGGEAD